MKSKILNFNVIIAGLGYFVDMYDLALFGIVRVPSLRALGLDGDELLRVGAELYSWQMSGMLIGGILWGILGDRRGRLSVLFGSILLYSAANFANAFVNTIEAYRILRFVAGVGLAGELGAAITLVAENMPKEIRGIGTTIVATLGLCGSAVAAMVGGVFEWRTAYIVGGIMGIGLLAARFKMRESAMFENVRREVARRGDLRLLFTRKRFPKYLYCILIGTPIWFVTGVLITFSPEFSKVLHIVGEITVPKAVFMVSIGLAFGDLASGLMSQWLRNRRKAVGIFLFAALVFSAAYLGFRGIPAYFFYSICLVLGIAAGYWAVFVTVASEQFGTNLRSTVTTTVPNFVRGSLVLILSFFQLLHWKFGLGLLESAAWVGAVCFTVAFYSLSRLEETFGKDLDFLEE